jgi:predicted GIY-YIG superfamily endonuclease
MAPHKIDFSKGIIYKIEAIDNKDLIYIGSTSNFIKRRSDHKSRCNNPKDQAHNFKLYRMIREHGGWDAFKCEIIKAFPSQNKKELLTEEEKYRKNLNSTLNTIKCCSESDILECFDNLTISN